MENYPRLAPCAYLVAFVMVVVPIFDSTMSVVPFHMESAQWRFGTFGLLSNALLIPVVGVLIAVVTALSMEHEGAQKALWVGSVALSVILLVSLGFFALDSLQTRSHINADVQTAFFVASATAAFKLLAASVIFGLFAYAIPGWDLFQLPSFRFRRD